MRSDYVGGLDAGEAALAGISQKTPGKIYSEPTWRQKVPVLACANNQLANLLL